MITTFNRGKQDGNDYLFVANKQKCNWHPNSNSPHSNQSQDDEMEIHYMPQANVGDEFNVVGCLNVASGASDIKGGNGSNLAYVDDLTCPKQW